MFSNLGVPSIVLLWIVFYLLPVVFFVEHRVCFHNRVLGPVYCNYHTKYFLVSCCCTTYERKFVNTCNVFLLLLSVLQ